MFMLLNMINMLCKLCLNIKYNCHWEFGVFNHYLCLSKHSIVIGKINFNKPKQQFKKKTTCNERFIVFRNTRIFDSLN